MAGIPHPTQGQLTPASMYVRFTLVESHFPPVLTKQYRLLPDATLEKLPGGRLVEGSATQLGVSSLKKDAHRIFRSHASGDRR